ncbi:hypothetical protein L7F22_057297 [Adiantum nelumboides]|nr:hypothetical protein [Adiantum nelumboides]
MQTCLCGMHDFGLLLTLLCLYSTSHLLSVASQQDYPSGDHLRDCTEHHKENVGYHCEPSLPACETLAYFRVRLGQFSSLTSIAKQLFDTTSAAIAQASNLSTLSSSLTPGQGLFIPFYCACNGTNISSHNVTYTILPGDTIVRIGNFTYEGLTTCQAIQDANPHLIVSGLVIGQVLKFPLRCACPSPAQRLRGIKFLVTYPIGSLPETVPSVVKMFRLNEQEFLQANKNVKKSTMLLAATTVLLPFQERPTQPPNASATSPFVPWQHSIMIHTAAVSVTPVILILIIVAAVLYSQKLRTKHAYKKTLFHPNAIASPNMLPAQNRRPSIDLFQVMSELVFNKRLIVFSSNDLHQATKGFNVSMKIKGGVYRATIEGKNVAVKKLEKDAIISQEIQILQTLHHTNIVSILGVCLPSPGHSYLVYEYAAGGSLHDWLHGRAQSGMSVERGFKVLEWHERLQIAFDVSTAMEYIHEHTNPRYVHNYINSSNILLDSNKRGKLANFSLAKVIDGNGNLDMVHPTDFGLQISLQQMVVENFLSNDCVKHARHSPKVDVYAFGLVLLEMLFEQESAEGNVETVRALLKGHDSKDKLRACMYSTFDIDIHKDCAYALAMLAYSCANPDPSIRPNARTVAVTLSRVRNACLSEHGSLLHRPCT